MDLRNIGTAGKARWQEYGLALCPEGQTKAQYKDSLCEVTKVDLRTLCDRFSCCVYENEKAKFKTGLNAVPLRTMRVILRRKIM